MTPNQASLLRIIAWGLAALLLSILAIAAGAQENKPTKTDWALLTVNAGTRSLDVYSTHQMLNRGGHEMLLPQAIASRPAAMAGVEALNIALLWWLDRKLSAHRHRKLARWLILSDTAIDAPWAIHNLTITKSAGSKISKRLPIR